MHNPSWMEQAVFAFFAIASAALFVTKFYPILEKIRRSKKDPGFSLSPVWPRVRTFLWEVMLQAKVIRERPLPGLAHAFVFWGFCIFVLVTGDHLARGFGWTLLNPQGPIGQFYFLFAAFFAVVVMVAIAGLFIRRFLVRPQWLGKKVSAESGFIAALIFILMATYVADYCGYTERWIWWLHTVALFIFLPLLPFTKHLHLLLSPFAIFFSRGGFSKIPALDGEEDFGLLTGKDITQIAALQAYSCVECGRCTEHCPAYNTGKLLNPKEIILGVRDYLNEFGPASEEPLLGKHISQEAVFQCTTCGACEYQCPVGIEHLPVIIGLRRGAVNTGEWEDDYGSKLFRNLEKNGNPLGMAASERDKFIQKNDLPIFDGTQEYCLWLGCMGSYDPKGRETVLALVEVLQHLKITFGVLKKEKCSGDSARRLGNDLLFEKLAGQNLTAMRTANVTKLLSACPHCVRTISEDWQEFGEVPAIEHHTEFLSRHLNQLPQVVEKDVVFHDPCYMSRYREVIDAPREDIAINASIREPAHTGKRSFCCGAGGGLAFLGEEKGNRVSETRAKELLQTGASTVAVACPFCSTMFRDALVQISDGSAMPELLDVVQIAAAGLKRSELISIDPVAEN